MSRTNGNRLGMILKGYPRISESFISTEILRLEALGVPIEIYSLRAPRERFTHAHVQHIRAPLTYLPEYVLPHWRVLLQSNRRLFAQAPRRYALCFASAVRRAAERHSSATLRHFLQAGHLAANRLCGRGIAHLHAHFCHTPTSVALFASELTGLPFSFTAHAKDIYLSEPEQVARKIGRARFVVTCTQYNAHYLKALADQAGLRTPIHTIYHGIDLDYFAWQPPRPPAPPYRILSVGRLVPKKGYDDLLHALKQLDAAGWQFQFTHIGSGEMEGELRQQVEALGLAERVSFLGTLSHSEVLAHYRQSHVFALACRVAENGDRDGIPNVLVEAMAVGLPVIATRVSAIPELITDGCEGRLVPPQAPEAMAEAIGALLSAPEENSRMAVCARAKVERDFDNRLAAARLQALFREALDPPCA